MRAPLWSAEKASANPTGASPRNAQYACPPVCWATTNIAAGTRSSSAKLQVRRWRSTHCFNSSWELHDQIEIAAAVSVRLIQIPSRAGALFGIHFAEQFEC